MPPPPRTKFCGRPVGQTRSAAHVDRPSSCTVFDFWLARRPYFFRRGFLCRTAGSRPAVEPGLAEAGFAQAGFAEPEASGLVAALGFVERGPLVAPARIVAKINVSTTLHSGNRRELSNHSFSSRCRAWLRTVALGPIRRPHIPIHLAHTSGRQALLERSGPRCSRRDSTRSRQAPYTNFDADSARAAAPRVQA